MDVNEELKFCVIRGEGGGSGVGLGVRVDVNEELKFCEIKGGGGLVGCRVGGSGWM